MDRSSASGSRRRKDLATATRMPPAVYHFRLHRTRSSHIRRLCSAAFRCHPHSPLLEDPRRAGIPPLRQGGRTGTTIARCRILACVIRSKPVLNKPLTRVFSIIFPLLAGISFFFIHIPASFPSFARRSFVLNNVPASFQHFLTLLRSSWGKADNDISSVWEGGWGSHP